MVGSRRLVVLWLPVAAYMALIFLLSSIAETPRLAEGMDKNVHALLYAGLGALFVRARAGGWNQPVTPGLVIATAGFCAAYGVSDEFHQWFVPPRQVDAFDVLADTIGGGAAALGLYLWSRRSAKTRGV